MMFLFLCLWIALSVAHAGSGAWLQVSEDGQVLEAVVLNEMRASVKYVAKMGNMLSRAEEDDSTEESFVQALRKRKIRWVHYDALFKTERLFGNNYHVYKDKAFGLTQDECDAGIKACLMDAQERYPKAKMITFLRGGLSTVAVADNFGMDVQPLLLTTRSGMQQRSTIDASIHSSVWKNDIVIIDDVCDTGRTAAVALLAAMRAKSDDPLLRIALYFVFMKGSHPHKFCGISYGTQEGDLPIIVDPLERILARVAEIAWCEEHSHTTNETLASSEFIAEKKFWARKLLGCLDSVAGFCNIGTDWLVLPTDGGDILARYKPVIKDLPVSGVVLLGAFDKCADKRGIYFSNMCLSKLLEECGERVWTYIYGEERDNVFSVVVKGTVPKNACMCACIVPHEGDVAYWSPKIEALYARCSQKIALPPLQIITGYADVCCGDAPVGSPYPAGKYDLMELEWKRCEYYSKERLKEVHANLALR